MNVRDARRRAVVLVVAVGVATLMQGPARARIQSKPLRAEKIVDFKADQLIELQITAGPVSIRTVKFQQNARESLGSRLRGRTATETETMMRASFDAENPEKDEWEVSFVIDFLDNRGKLIDRAKGSSTWEGEAKIFNLDHPMLTYAVPFVDRVKISLSAKLD